jgi:cysteine desulfurase
VSLRIYLDNASTSRPFPRVIEAVARAMDLVYGNPSSRHGMGLAASQVLEEGRARLAAAIGARPGEIVFTSGGSEANSLALKGAATAYARSGSHLVVSSVEHPSVLKTAQWLAASREDAQDRREPALTGGRTGGGRREVTLVPVDHDGRVCSKSVLDAVTEETVLVSLMHVNNEVGAVEPVLEVGKGLAVIRSPAGRRKGLPLFHVDAVQSLGRLPVDVRAWSADLVSVSAHKIHGPKGVGALFVREGVRLAPLIHGGGHEHGLRSGTENVPGIAGFSAALAALSDLEAGLDRRLGELRSRLVTIVGEGYPQVLLLGPQPGEEVAPHLLCLSFPGLPAEVFQHHLERAGVYVSTGSACSSHHRDRASHVLEAMGLPPSVIGSALRFSLSPLTTRDEIEEAGRIVVATAMELSREAIR